MEITLKLRKDFLWAMINKQFLHLELILNKREFSKVFFSNGYSKILILFTLNDYY